MKIGFLCSSGGSSPLTVSRLLANAGVMVRDSFVLLADRECGAIEAFTRAGIKTNKIQYTDRISFSQAAADFFIREGVGIVFLFYSRIISEELFAHIPVVNCHPSLLPAFPGFGALGKTVKSGFRFVGATSHVVNDNADAGQILVQAAYPMPSNAGTLDGISFVQRILVTLVCVDHLISGNCRIDPVVQRGYWVRHPQSSLSVSPTFSNERLAEVFLEFQRSVGITAMQIFPIFPELTIASHQAEGDNAMFADNPAIENNMSVNEIRSEI